MAPAPRDGSPGDLRGKTVDLYGQGSRQGFAVRVLLYAVLFLVQVAEGQLLAMGAVACLCCYALLRTVLGDGQLLRSCIAVAFLWAFLIVGLVRPDFATDIETGIETLWLFLGVGMLIAASAKGIGRGVNCSDLYEPALIGAFMVLVSVVSQSTVGGLLNPPYAGTRHVGGFDGPNEMGAFYLISLFLMLGDHALRRPVPFLWVKVGVFVTVVVSSWSRGALIGLGCGCVFLVWTVFRCTQGGKRMRLVASSLVGVSVVTLLYHLIVEPRLIAVRSSAGDRTYLLYSTWSIVRSSPVFGRGLGSYWFLTDGVNATPHSEYLLFLVSGGLAGVVILAAFFAYWFYQATRKGMYPEALGLAVFYILEAFFNNLVRGRVSFLFWSIVFLVMCDTGFREGPAACQVSGQQPSVLPLRPSVRERGAP